jgi:hypothetical protein
MGRLNFETSNWDLELDKSIYNIKKLCTANIIVGSAELFLLG